MFDQERKIEISLIRAGKTQSDSNGQRFDLEDESLLESEIERIASRVDNKIYAPASRVYTSSMQRSIETAYIIYKGIPATAIRGIEPFDYGEVERKDSKDIPHSLNNKFFSTDDFFDTPNGEPPYAFTARVNSAFKNIVKEIKRTNINNIAIITHKTVIVTLIRRYIMPRSILRTVKLDYGGGIKMEYDYDSEMGRIVEYF